MKYLKAYVIEVSIAFTCTMLFIAVINKDGISVSGINKVFIFMSAIIIYQLLLQFIVEFRNFSYWNLKVIITGYLGGTVVFMAVGMAIDYIEFDIRSIIVYLIIHSFILFIEYEREVKDVKKINEKINEKIKEGENNV